MDDDEYKPVFHAGFFEFNISPATDVGFLIYEAPNTANPAAALTTPREVGDWITERLRKYTGEPDTISEATRAEPTERPRVIRMWSKR